VKRTMGKYTKILAQRLKKNLMGKSRRQLGRKVGKIIMKSRQHLMGKLPRRILPNQIPKLGIIITLNICFV